MRFASFKSDRLLYGCLLSDQRIVSLPAAASFLYERGFMDSSVVAYANCPDLKHWLRLPNGVEMARRVMEGCDQIPEEYAPPLSEVRLLAPLPNPDKILAIGLNYRDHAEEQNVSLPTRPLLFAKFPSAIIGPEEPIQLPTISTQVDPEAELVAVVLERCRSVSARDVPGKLAFTIGNDVSARDLQFSDKQWVRAKSLDSFAPVGPWIVTEDELENPHDLNISLSVNGEIRQASNTSNLIFDCYQLVSFLSEAITLEPGDLIFTGTPAGVGVFRDPPVFLQAGDEVEVSIDLLGTLRNPVQG